MITAVIGATGRVGSEIVRGLLGRGDAVTALVRDPGKARRVFGEPDGLHIGPTRLADPRDLAAASPSPSGPQLSGSSSNASPAPGYQQGRLNFSSRASGQSSPAALTCDPAVTAQMQAAAVRIASIVALGRENIETSEPLTSVTAADERTR